MTTARDTIRGALRLIRAIDPTEDLEADDAATGLFAMNQMIHSWDSEGAIINYSDIELTDELPFPKSDHRNIRYLLAVELAAEYSLELTPEVATSAENALESITSKYGIQPESRPDLSITNRLSRYGNVYNIKTDSV